MNADADDVLPVPTWLTERDSWQPPASAPQPLTGDELATIKARHDCWTCAANNPHLCTTLRLVAEVERLRAQEVRVREVEASVRRYRLTSVADDIRAALDGP
jgi:hypothetical protein